MLATVFVIILLILILLLINWFGAEVFWEEKEAQSQTFRNNYNRLQSYRSLQREQKLLLKYHPSACRPFI